MKKRINFLLPVLLLVSTLTAFAQEDTKAAKQEYPKSEEFVEKAASAGIMEVQLGEMAMEKASSESVKDFGKMMVDDHSKANDELKMLASSNGYTVPENMLDKHQKTVNKLAKLDGEEFEQEYMKTMVKDHKKDVSEFEKASKNAEDSEVQAWAQKTVDVLRHHLQMAEDIQQSVQAAAN